MQCRNVARTVAREEVKVGQSVNAQDYHLRVVSSISSAGEVEIILIIPIRGPPL